ncbi:MAG: cation diffusion facilitator family transporter, partial [Planctomycetota bacterium]
RRATGRISIVGTTFHAPATHSSRITWERPTAPNQQLSKKSLRAAYLHVLADALTSVFALAALVTGKLLAWTWMDPLMGVIGSVVIARWSYGLIRDTSGVLLDAEVDEAERKAILAIIEADQVSHVVDLHVWRVGPRHFAAIVAIVTREARPPDQYRRLLASRPDLVHVTVEVIPVA